LAAEISKKLSPETYLSLADLPQGSRAEIVAFHDYLLSLRLMQFGFTPGTTLSIDGYAPLGCPVCIRLEGDYRLSMRVAEAESIEVRLV
jgi:Fe2+ transport system protein FeoA